MSFAAPSGLYAWMSSPATTTIVCDVRALAPDAVAVDALARLQLAARRLGLELRLRHASSELQELLAFVGLRDVLRRRGGRAGRRAGRACSVSRKNVNSAIRPADSSSTCKRPRLVAAVRARLVLAERRRAVRRHGRDHARALAADPRPEPPREDVVAAAQPQVERRHRLRRVLLDQRGERVDVVALERLDVAGEQRAVGSSSAGDGSVALTLLGGERRPRPLQRAVHRGDARVEELRRPRSPASGGPRRGSAPPAGAAEGAAARRRTRAGSSRARRRRRPDPGSAGSTSPPAACSGSRRRARAPGRGPSGARGARGRSACRGRRSWRCGRATSAAPPGPRSGRSRATRGSASPGRRPRPRTASRASGSSSRSAPRDAARADPPARRPRAGGERRFLHDAHRTDPRTGAEAVAVLSTLPPCRPARRMRAAGPSRAPSSGRSGSWPSRLPALGTKPPTKPRSPAHRRARGSGSTS